MKKFKVLVCVVVAFVLFSFGALRAEDANQPKEIPKEPNQSAPQETPKDTPKEQPKDQAKEKHLIIGILTVVKDNDGNFIEMTITAHKDLKYKVVIDNKSKAMAQSFSDKRVRVEGFVETIDGVKWLTVDTFGQLKAGTSSKGGAKGTGKAAQRPVPKSRK